MSIMAGGGRRKKQSLGDSVSIFNGGGHLYIYIEREAHADDDEAPLLQQKKTFTRKQKIKKKTEQFASNVIIVIQKIIISKKRGRKTDCFA